METGSLAATQVWWDPKDRKMIFNPTTVVAGLLIVLRGSLTFTHPPNNVVFSVPMERVSISWLNIRAAIDIEGLDRSYRLFFVPPVSGVPKLSQRRAAALAEGLATSAQAGSAVGGIVGAGGSALQSAGQIGQLVSVVTDGIAWANGRRNFTRFKRLIQDDPHV
jgi:hypothetical protein